LELVQHPERAHPRTSMFVLASMASARASGPVKVRNMSPDGALIEGATLPGVGDSLSLRRGELNASGRIVWQDGGKAGVRFDHHVQVADWLPAGAARQQLVEQTVHELKNIPATPAPEPAAPRAPVAPSPVERVDLLETADALDALADALAENPQVIVDHSTRLQVLDVAAQLLRRCAVTSRT